MVIVPLLLFIVGCGASPQLTSTDSGSVAIIVKHAHGVHELIAELERNAATQRQVEPLIRTYERTRDPSVLNQIAAITPGVVERDPITAQPTGLNPALAQTYLGPIPTQRQLCATPPLPNDISQLRQIFAGKSAKTIVPSEHNATAPTVLDDIADGYRSGHCDSAAAEVEALRHGLSA